MFMKETSKTDKQGSELKGGETKNDWRTSEVKKRICMNSEVAKKQWSMLIKKQEKLQTIKLIK